MIYQYIAYLAVVLNCYKYVLSIVTKGICPSAKSIARVLPHFWLSTCPHEQRRHLKDLLSPQTILPRTEIFSYSRSVLKQMLQVSSEENRDINVSAISAGFTL